MGAAVSTAASIEDGDKPFDVNAMPEEIVDEEFRQQVSNNSK